MLTNLYSYRNSLLTLTIFIITLFSNIKAAAINKDHLCYAPQFLNSSWTDSRPEFIVNMTFTEQGSIRSLTWVNKEITSPIMKIQILQKDHNHKISTLYNVTTRLCDLYQFTSKISMFQQAFQTALKQGNYSMNCPMKVGFYVMDNARVGLRNPILGFLHRPKTFYNIIGGLYEETTNKSLIALTTYNFTFKIAKRSCKEY